MRSFRSINQSINQSIHLFLFQPACLKTDLGCMFFQRVMASKCHGKVTYSQAPFTCSKLTTEILEQGVKYVQS